MVETNRELDDDRERGLLASRSRPTRIGLLAITSGLLMLIALRFVTSPVGRQITGREAVGMVEFLMIPLFLALVGGGIVLMVWQPTGGD